MIGRMAIPAFLAFLLFAELCLAEANTKEACTGPTIRSPLCKKGVRGDSLPAPANILEANPRPSVAKRGGHSRVSPMAGLSLAEIRRLDKLTQSGDFSVLTVESPSQRRILQRPSRAIDPASPGLDRLIDYLEKTARQQGGLGMAAVQVGIPVKLVLVRRRDAEGSERFQAFINPKIIRRSASRLASWENCLSVPWGYRFTYRPAQISFRHQTAMGQTQIETLKGEEAVIFQQETDHLNGLLLSHRHSRKWFVPPDEIDTLARSIWRQCQTISKRQCDKIMQTSWKRRALSAVPPRFPNSH